MMIVVCLLPKMVSTCHGDVDVLVVVCFCHAGDNIAKAMAVVVVVLCCGVATRILLLLLLVLVAVFGATTRSGAMTHVMVRWC